MQKQFLHTCATVHLYSFLDLHLATRKTQYVILYMYLSILKHNNHDELQGT